MESFTELLSDAFSETSGPSFASEDLDFENLNFDDNCEEGEGESVTTERDGALLQEAAGETTVLFGEEAEDVSSEKLFRERLNDESDEEDFQGKGVHLMCRDKAEEDYTSSEGDCEEEGSASGDDGEAPGDLLVSVRRADEVSICEKEDRIFAGGRPLAPQSAENPQVSNKAQGESESHEELSYFGQVPEKGSKTAVESEASEEDEQESDGGKQEPGPESQGMRIEVADHTQPTNSPPPSTAAGLSLQDLITGGDGEDRGEKMREFSGEEHQEAGESFADYPSDFSSCEYVDDQDSDRKADASTGSSDWSSSPQRSRSLGPDVMDAMWSSREMDPEGAVSLTVAGTEESQRKSAIVELLEGDGDQTSESDSYSSSDDEVNVRRSSEEASGNWGQQVSQSKSELNDARLSVFGTSDDSRVNPEDFVSWDFDVLKTDRLLSELVLTTENNGQAETHTSGVNQRHTEETNSYSVVKREDTTGLETGVEASGVTGRGHDEYEEERNWEQEQERIKAFYEYYDDSDEDNETERRQIKVQFCADPLSRVIHYETDSDGDSLSSSTDREDDQSSADTSDELVEPGSTPHPKPECDPPAPQLQDSEPNIRNMQICEGQPRCVRMLKLMLNMSLAMVAGLLMLWLATEEDHWLHQVSIFSNNNSSFFH